MVSEKKIFKVFCIISLWELMTLGHGQFGPKGLDWQDLCNGPLHIATYYIYKLWASRFLRSFLSFSHYKSMGANDPRGGSQFRPQGLDLDHRGMVGRIYVGDH